MESIEARRGCCDLLRSGDMLCLYPLGELHILTPRAALDEIRQGGGVLQDETVPAES